MDLLTQLLKEYPQKSDEYLCLTENVRKNPKDISAKAQLDRFMSLACRLAQSVTWLGKTVGITMDRPVGSPHPKRTEIRYPINYGYIDGVISGDGEEFDVYLLGLSEPVEKYDAKIIGVIHRLDDVEDKLVASADGKPQAAEYIKSSCFFQEKYYNSEIICLGSNDVFPGVTKSEQKGKA